MLVVKRGGRGASAYIQGEGGTVSETSIPAFHVKSVDTTGAGDAFNAGFIYALQIRGENLESALRFAAGCGAQATLYVGGATAAPTAHLIREQIADWEQQE
jgi:ribokinase